MNANEIIKNLNIIANYHYPNLNKDFKDLTTKNNLMIIENETMSNKIHSLNSKVSKFKSDVLALENLLNESEKEKNKSILKYRKCKTLYNMQQKKLEASKAKTEILEKKLVETENKVFALLNYEERFQSISILERSSDEKSEKGSERSEKGSEKGSEKSLNIIKDKIYDHDLSFKSQRLSREVSIDLKNRKNIHEHENEIYQCDYMHSSNKQSMPDNVIVLDLSVREEKSTKVENKQTKSLDIRESKCLHIANRSSKYIKSEELSDQKIHKLHSVKKIKENYSTKIILKKSNNKELIIVKRFI